MMKLLIIGSGSQLYREYSISSIAKKYSILLIQQDEPTWQKAYVHDFALANMMDEKEVIEAAKHLQMKHNINGILTYEEPSVELTALVARELNLKYISINSAKLCRDKYLMREAFNKSNISLCNSYIVNSEEEAVFYANKIGFPIVLKPAKMASSIGVVKVESEKDLPESYRIAASATNSRFSKKQVILLEEYLDGPEYSVESVVTGSNVSVVAITRKEIGFHPYFEEIGHQVSPSEFFEQKQLIEELVINAHHVLEVDMGVTHTEVRLTKKGPRLIELGARLGGDLIPYLVYLSTGIDLSLAAADIAVGVEPNLIPTRNKASLIRFIYPNNDVRIKKLSVEPIVFTWNGVHQVTWEVKSGDLFLLPPKEFSMRLGFIITVAEKVKNCIEINERVCKNLIIEVQNL
ncbi:ATP-grasp domain-containing protein [Nostoc parmelioides]|uniref:ATP-grasp domain-containing protein n=1 Tax=Nostoc parmelioides FACHB-3921 TaxID=2692909 RepID=A0ABR8BRL6_9NOSO|nr:ATP-grasp domain-containing protein [Nostoc parmelioides]MBD2255550.1 ATP-grasp domain-containing protein [Nostoc parmelioides FACHB-3921]